MAASTYAAPAAAQVDGSVGVGAGTVRYPGGTSFGSAILSPSARYTSAALVADVSSSITSLPVGDWVGLGLLDLSAVPPPTGRGRQRGLQAVFAGSPGTGDRPTPSARPAGRPRSSGSS